LIHSVETHCARRYIYRLSCSIIINSRKILIYTLIIISGIFKFCGMLYIAIKDGSVIILLEQAA
jgi:hypothetical protein